MSEPAYFLDTNIIIRFLANDAPESVDKARSFLAGLEAGHTGAELSELVVYECTHVLTKHYSKTREYVATTLSTILALPSIRLTNKAAVIEALQVWSRIQRLSFADAYHLVLASHSTHRTIASFDKGLDNCLPGVTRIEQFP